MDQPEYGTNTSYLTDFVEICLSAKFASPEEIRTLYVEKGFSSAQIAAKFHISKSVVLDRLKAQGITQATAPKSFTSPENYRCPSAPFGYSVVAGKLVPNKTELRVCHAVVELMKRQGLSARAAGKELSKQGLKNRAGKLKWGHATVLSIYERWKDKI